VHASPAVRLYPTKSTVFSKLIGLPKLNTTALGKFIYNLCDCGYSLKRNSIIQALSAHVPNQMQSNGENLFKVLELPTWRLPEGVTTVIS
jgi:hypothetical protein